MSEPCAYVDTSGWSTATCGLDKYASTHTCFGRNLDAHNGRQSLFDHKFVPPSSTLRERLAGLEHDQWMAWSQNIATSETISPERLSRWAAMWVPYDELTEDQKDMDREWADKVLGVFDKPPSTVV